ncbi:MAG: histidinol-phosphate transaminase [Verrucomicrobiae bacterium]|nr:histidinol-phosphate transaminase [Verrucomicrobiae bacterium]
MTTPYLSLANRFVCDIPRYEAGRPVEEVARRYRLDPQRIIKLASNENALGPSPRAVEAMRVALKEMHRYPDGGVFYLRRDLAKQLGVTPEHLVFGCGSNEIIELLFHAFVTPGDEVVVGDRAFVIYKFLCTTFQARCVEVPFREHTHDLRAMRTAISPRTKLVFIANPNNPTGTRVSNEELDWFVRQLPSHVICVLDEAYVEFLDDPPPSVGYALSHRVVLLRTFSKIVGLAGLRIGYGIAQPSCIELLERVRQPFNVSAVAQVGARAALRDRAHIRRTVAMTRAGMRFLTDEFRRLGLEFIPSVANFVMVNVHDGDRVFERLQRRGIIVRPMRAYGMPQWIRVTIGRPQENRAFVRALRSELNGEA